VSTEILEEKVPESKVLSRWGHLKKRRGGHSTKGDE